MGSFPDAILLCFYCYGTLKSTLAERIDVMYVSLKEDFKQNPIITDKKRIAYLPLPPFCFWMNKLRRNVRIANSSKKKIR